MAISGFKTFEALTAADLDTQIEAFLAAQNLFITTFDLEFRTAKKSDFLGSSRTPPDHAGGSPDHAGGGDGEDNEGEGGGEKVLVYVVSISYSD